MIRKIMAVLFALAAVAAAVIGVRLALQNIGAPPVLLEAPQAAEQLVVESMEALCSGDYTALCANLYGENDWGEERPAEDPVGSLFYEAYLKSLNYSLTSECYATNTGVAVDVSVSGLDLAAITKALGPRSQQLLEEYVQQAEDISQVYDSTGAYREDVVMDALYEAAKQVLKENTDTLCWNLTLECIYEEGRWWIIPPDELHEIAGGVR